MCVDTFLSPGSPRKRGSPMAGAQYFAPCTPPFSQALLLVATCGRVSWKGRTVVTLRGELVGDPACWMEGQKMILVIVKR